MTQGVVVLDAAGRVVWVNPQVSRLLGWAPAQLVGGDVHDTFHQHGHRLAPPAQPCELLDAARTGVSARHDADLFLRADGPLLPVAWVADPLPADPAEAVSDPDDLDHSGDPGDVSGSSGGWTGVVVRFIDVTVAQEHAVSEEASREQGRAALWDAQQSISDLGWIAELTRVMSSTMDEAESLGRLARLLTPRLADICVVDVVDADGDLRRLGGSVALGVDIDLDMVLADPAVQHRRDDTATRETVSTQAVTRLDAGMMADLSVLSDPSRRLLARLGARSLLVVPLAARNRMVGIAGLIRCSDDAYSDDDLLLAADIGRRAGLVLDNARLYQVEQRMAEHLQLALLPAIRQLDHVDVAARYLPAADRHRVGGDWYDVFTCPTADTGTDTGTDAGADTHILVVGDVAGHDLRAATTMAALRNLLRGVAVTGTGGPATVLDTVDRALPVLDIRGTATVTVVRAARDTVDADGLVGWTLTWSSAGHPPAVVVDPTGRTVTLLAERPDPLLGARSGRDRHEHTVRVPAGSMVLLYSDGLVEQRHEDLDRGLQRLRHAATGDPVSADAMLDRVVTAMPASPDDDTVVLVARLL